MRMGYSLGIGLGVIAVLLIAVTAILPSHVERQGEVLLCVEQDTAFGLFDEMAEVATWSTLIGAVPEDERVLEGPAAGEEAVARLEDEEGRWIRLEIVESLSPERVRYRFTSHQDLGARARVDLAPVSEGTEVRLRLGVDFQGFFSRWAVVFIRGALDDVIREELASVRGLLEERGYACPE